MSRMREIEIEGIGFALVDEELYRAYKENGDKLPDINSYTFTSIGGGETFIYEEETSEEDS